MSFLLLEGMGDWMLASPRLSGFIKPELAVSWGGGLKGHSEVKGANTEMCQDLGETPPGISRWPCIPFLGITGRYRSCRLEASGFLQSPALLSLEVGKETKS